jgi:hypothetical protein
MIALRGMREQLMNGLILQACMDDEVGLLSSLYFNFRL